MAGDSKGRGGGANEAGLVATLDKSEKLYVTRITNEGGMGGTGEY